MKSLKETLKEALPGMDSHAGMAPDLKLSGDLIKFLQKNSNSGAFIAGAIKHAFPDVQARKKFLKDLEYSVNQAERIPED